MKLDKKFYLQITPKIEIINNGEEEVYTHTGFDWGLLNSPNFVTNPATGDILFDFTGRGYNKPTITDIQLMRLFCCQIFRDLIKGDIRLDQKDIVHEIKFELTPEIESSVCEVIKSLSNKLLAEIIYQNDPLKTTKSRLKPVSLTSKDATNE